MENVPGIISRGAIFVTIGVRAVARRRRSCHDCDRMSPGLPPVDKDISTEAVLMPAQ